MDTEMTPLLQKEPDQGGEYAKLKGILRQSFSSQYLLSYYLVNKQSLHVRSQGLKVPTLIRRK